MSKSTSFNDSNCHETPEQQQEKSSNTKKSSDVFSNLDKSGSFWGDWDRDQPAGKDDLLKK